MESLSTCGSFTSVFLLPVHTHYGSVHSWLNFYLLVFLTLSFTSSLSQAGICQIFFQFKDVIPKLTRSHIVYKYKCQCCGALYFGKTCRHLHMRISEHLGISPLSGKKLICSSLSAIQAHTRTTCHPISFDDFSIMSYCNTASELLIRESLLISKFKPELNETIRSVPLVLF